MRWIKWAILGIVVLIVVVVVAGYIILSSYNFNDLKPQIAQAAKDATGRELKLGGDIKLQIGLTPALAVENVSFQNAPWGSRPELAKVKRFEVQVALMPLLSGNIGIKKLILVEPDILVESDKTGKSNLTFDVAKKPEPAAKEPPVKGAAKLPALTFDQVRLDKARLTYKDGTTGKSMVVALDSLVADAPSMSGPVKLALKGAYNDKPFEVAGTLGPILGVMDAAKPWPLKIEAKAGGATVAAEGQITDLQNLKAVALVLNVQGQSIPELAKLADVKDVPDVGPFKVAVKVSGSAAKPVVDSLDVDVGTEELAKVKLTGTVKDVMAQKGVELNFVLKGKELANLEKLSKQPLPIKGPFEISGKAVDTGVKAYKVSDIKVALPNMDLSGTAEANLADKRPKLTASLTSQKMDLRPFMPKEEKKAATPAKAEKPAVKKDKVFPNEPLPLDGLKQADADVKIRAKQIITPQMALDDLTVDLVLQDGHLTVKPLKALVGGGNLDGSVDLLPQGNAMALTMALKIDKLDVGRMAKEMQVTETLEGRLDAEVDLKGQGASVAAIMGGLNGKTVLVMGQGRLDNKYIELLGADIGSSLFRLINPFEKEKKYTEINCMVSRFDIKDGLAQSTALVFDTSRMSVVGDGKINLKTEELDLSLKPSPKGGAGAAGIGTVGLSMSELAKPFKLGGTMASPSLALDPAQAAMTVAKSVGGTALMGPAGIAAALATGGGSKDENPCVKALDAAKTGVQAQPQEKGAAEKVTEGVKGGAKGAAEGVGGGLKKLFGK